MKKNPKQANKQTKTLYCQRPCLKYSRLHLSFLSCCYTRASSHPEREAGSSDGSSRGDSMGTHVTWLGLSTECKMIPRHESIPGDRVLAFCLFCPWSWQELLGVRAADKEQSIFSFSLMMWSKKFWNASGKGIFFNDHKTSARTKPSSVWIQNSPTEEHYTLSDIIICLWVGQPIKSNGQ